MLECDVQRFNGREALVYIRTRLGQDISIEYFESIKRNIRRSLASKINHLREHKTAYIEQFFRRIAEIEKYQQALWNEYNLHPEKPYLRKDIIHELHELTVTLANLYEILPAFTHSLDGKTDLSLHHAPSASTPVEPTGV